MTTPIRTFGNRRYYLDSLFITKRAATAKAKQLRLRGALVRVIKAGGGFWELWLHLKR